MDHGQRLMRERQALNDAAPPVPRPVVAPIPVVQRPQAVPPAGFGTEFGQVAGALNQLLAETRRNSALLAEFVGNQKTLMRMGWNGLIGDGLSEPTSIALPQGTTYNPSGGNGFDGGGGGSPFTGSTYLPFFRNTRTYPIGVRIVGYFNTVGAGLKFSMNSSDASRWGSVSNAGGGSTHTGIKRLLPNDAVYAANVDPGVVITNNDVFLVQVFDLRQFLEAANYPGEPWAGA
jgi:hypothetical protein